MFILMHCGGMPFDGDVIKNRLSLGGSESAAYYVARELAARGHKVTLFTNMVGPDAEFEGVAYRSAGRVTEQTPLGDRYHTYAVATPHDLNITQRHPAAFLIPVAAKVRALWLHDLPDPQVRDRMHQALLGVDIVFTVSEWHRQRVIKAWGVNPKVVCSIRNGVDLELFQGAIAPQDLTILGLPSNDLRLLYSSRPERGLETLVKPDGVMDRLAAEGANVCLYVCGYDNVVPQMRRYYQWLWERCETLPNVVNLGPLSKQQLAVAMRLADLLAYPTIFKETCCITAQEAQVAGLPILSSRCGALPEICTNGSAELLDLLPDREPKPGRMEQGILNRQVNVNQFVAHVRQRAAAKPLKPEVTEKLSNYHSWGGVVDRLETRVAGAFETSVSTNARGLLRNSDIYALWKLLDSEIPELDSIADSVKHELRECYRFMDDQDNWAAHYAAYYGYERNRGVEYGPEDLSGNARFVYVAELVSKLPIHSRVLDYGCAHGHYTINLAKRFPRLQFLGIDLVQSNIDIARRWAEEENLAGRVQFVRGAVAPGDSLPLFDVDGGWKESSFDMILAGEVMEHIEAPEFIASRLLTALEPDGRMVITTPYGPWEAQGYQEHWPWRAHVHHFEREDLHDMWGQFPGFAITAISAGRSALGESLGSYVTQFRPKPGAQVGGVIDYDRKLRQLAPRQTLSVCMIVKDVESDIRRCLKSVAPVADELIIAIDSSTTDRTAEVIDDVIDDLFKGCATDVYLQESPLHLGFAEARNRCIKRATGDWILWVDADEVLFGAARLAELLRSNGYNGYSIAHHHVSCEPAEILKTDLPLRVFRNRRGVQFFGCVHEHPEDQLNKGVAHSVVVPGVAVMHYGYSTEATRKRRFDRNYPLMLRDRKENPSRILGQFLWVRDLFQLNRYELEGRGTVSSRMLERSRQGIGLWRGLVRQGQKRLAVESLEWYSGLVALRGEGVEHTIELDGLKIQGVFATQRDYRDLLALVTTDE